MREKYAIHLATAAHLPYLGNIETAAATLFPSGSIPDHIRSESLPLSVLREGAARGLLWVAVFGDRALPVGYALLRMIDEIALLAQMDVLPEHGRKGLGRRLVDRAAMAASTAGHGELWLTTFTHVPWNAPFYARIGFQPVRMPDLPPPMARILTEERAAGLEHRTAMRLCLS